MFKDSKKISRLLSWIESNWSLWSLIKGSGLVASFGATAWAVKAANLFSQYAPFSWVLSGFLGLFLTVCMNWIWQYSYKIKINAQYDEKFLSTGLKINPLNQTFENQRIFLNDFTIPSHPIVEGKTFINCEIIGPANMYWCIGNSADNIRSPNSIDAISLDPDKYFYNGITFNNCIFRGCSFQRITLFVHQNEYTHFKDNNILNWISLTPKANDSQLPLLPKKVKSNDK